MKQFLGNINSCRCAEIHPLEVGRVGQIGLQLDSHRGNSRRALHPGEVASAKGGVNFGFWIADFGFPLPDHSRG